MAEHVTHLRIVGDHRTMKYKEAASQSFVAGQLLEIASGIAQIAGVSSSIVNGADTLGLALGAASGVTSDECLVAIIDSNTVLQGTLTASGADTAGTYADAILVEGTHYDIRKTATGEFTPNLAQGQNTIMILSLVPGTDTDPFAEVQFKLLSAKRAIGA